MSRWLKRGTGKTALLRVAAGLVYLGTILWVVLHPSGREGDLVNFRDNAARAVPVAACMALAAGLYVLASKASSYRGTAALGCGSSLLGFAAVLIASFTVVPESWSQGELGHFVGNVLWVAAMPGLIVFVVGLRLKRTAKEAEQRNR